MKTPRAGRFCSHACSRKAIGPDHNHWKGGETIHSNGYRRVWVDGRYRWEHHVVAERVLGRPLRKGETVHHRNRDKLDNRPENLEVMHSHREHMHEHHDEIRERGKRRRNQPNPTNAARMKARWADPVHRLAMTNAIRRGKGLSPLARL